MKAIKLVAPNMLPIRHIRLSDGTASEFECRFRSLNGVSEFFYALPNGSTRGVLVVDGENVLIDSDRNEWLTSDVELISIPRVDGLN